MASEEINSTLSPGSPGNIATAVVARDDSQLLALPMELLIRITDLLNDESISTLRLTCKTLEGTIFDRFVSTFSVAYCCIYHESRWLSLQRFLNGSSRLVRSLARIEFTTDPMENAAYTDIHLAPSQYFSSIEDAQRQFDPLMSDGEEPYEPAHTDRRPTNALIHSVLLDVSESEVPLALNMVDTRFFRDEDPVLYKDIFLAIASTTCFVNELSLSRRCLNGIGDLTAHLGPRLLTCISSMYSFSFDSTDDSDPEYGDELDEGKLDFLIDMLQHAESLGSFTLEMLEFRFPLETGTTITRKLLFAPNLTNLSHLCLGGTAVSEKRLSEVLSSSCRSSLISVQLGLVRLMECDKGWTAIFQVLLALPKLCWLALSDLMMTDNTDRQNSPRVLRLQLVLRDMKDVDGDSRARIAFGTRRKVAAALQEFSNGSLTYYDLGPARYYTWGRLKAATN